MLAHGGASRVRASRLGASPTKAASQCTEIQGKATGFDAYCRGFGRFWVIEILIKFNRCKLNEEHVARTKILGKPASAANPAIFAMLSSHDVDTKPQLLTSLFTSEFFEKAADWVFGQQAGLAFEAMGDSNATESAAHDALIYSVNTPPAGLNHKL